MTKEGTFDANAKPSVLNNKRGLETDHWQGGGGQDEGAINSTEAGGWERRT